MSPKNVKNIMKYAQAKRVHVHNNITYMVLNYTRDRNTIDAVMCTHNFHDDDDDVQWMVYNKKVLAESEVISL